MAVRRKSKQTVRWFGVKTLYRTTAQGRPRSIDEHYDPNVTMVEERVLVFRARSFHLAIRAAEREAREYAHGRCTNLYGQRVLTKYLGACDAFELSGSPGDCSEVYSRTELVSRRKRDRHVVDTLLGAEERHRAHATRRKFLDREVTPKNWPERTG